MRVNKNKLFDIFSYLFFYGISHKYSFLAIEEKIYKSDIVKSLESNGSSTYLYRHTLQDIFIDIYGDDINIDDITKTNSISIWVAEAYIRLFFRYHKSFHYLFLVIHLEQMINLFDIYHEMDFDQLFELFEKKQKSFKLLNALIKEKNITIKQLNLLSSISEYTLYNYSKNNEKLYAASFNHIVTLSNILDVDCNVFARELNNYEDYFIYNFEKNDTYYYSLLAIYYLDYFFKIDSQCYAANLEDTSLRREDDIIQVIFLNGNNIAMISSLENKMIEPLVSNYQSKCQEVDKTQLVVFEWNQISTNGKVYSKLSKYGFKNIYIINQENIIRVSDKGTTITKQIPEYVSSYLSRRAKKELNL